MRMCSHWNFCMSLVPQTSQDGFVNNPTVPQLAQQLVPQLFKVILWSTAPGHTLEEMFRTDPEGQKTGQWLPRTMGTTMD